MKRDTIQLTSLEAQATLTEKQQMIAAAQKGMQDAQAAATANDQKVKDLTASIAATEAQKVAQLDTMKKSQKHRC